MNKNLHFALRQAVRTNAAYRILDKYGPEFYDQGGCLVLAVALQRLLGGKIRGVWGYHTRYGDSKISCGHYVLELAPGVYVDSNGIQDEAGVADRMMENFWVRVTDIKPGRKPNHDINHPDKVFYVAACVDEIEAYLRPRLPIGSTT
jgi:hypothetical protein